jgi:hypothetical protein
MILGKENLFFLLDKLIKLKVLSSKVGLCLKSSAGILPDLKGI